MSTCGQCNSCQTNPTSPTHYICERGLFQAVTTGQSACDDFTPRVSNNVLFDSVIFHLILSLPLILITGLISYFKKGFISPGTVVMNGIMAYIMVRVVIYGIKVVNSVVKSVQYRVIQIIVIIMAVLMLGWLVWGFLF